MQEEFIEMCEKRYGMRLVSQASGLALFETIAEGFEAIVVLPRDRAELWMAHKLSCTTAGRVIRQRSNRSRSSVLGELSQLAAPG